MPPPLQTSLQTQPLVQGAVSPAVQLPQILTSPLLPGVLAATTQPLSDLYLQICAALERTLDATHDPRMRSQLAPQLHHARMGLMYSTQLESGSVLPEPALGGSAGGVGGGSGVGGGAGIGGGAAMAGGGVMTPALAAPARPVVTLSEAAMPFPSVSAAVSATAPLYVSGTPQLTQPAIVAPQPTAPASIPWPSQGPVGLPTTT